MKLQFASFFAEIIQNTSTLILCNSAEIKLFYRVTSDESLYESTRYSWFLEQIYAEVSLFLSTDCFTSNDE